MRKPDDVAHAVYRLNCYAHCIASLIRADTKSPETKDWLHVWAERTNNDIEFSVLSLCITQTINQAILSWGKEPLLDLIETARNVATTNWVHAYYDCCLWYIHTHFKGDIYNA